MALGPEPRRLRRMTVRPVDMGILLGLVVHLRATSGDMREAPGRHV